MESNIQQLKIKLGFSKGTTKYYQLQEQWENEGGAPKDQPENSPMPEIVPPIKEGDYFRVISGSIDLIEDDLFYIAYIQKVDIDKL